MAASSCDDERRTLSGKKGKARGGLWTKRRWGKVREGVEGVSVAHFGVLGWPGSSWALRWRPRRRRRATELLGSAGWKTTRRASRAGPAGEVGLAPGREVSSFSFSV